MISPRFFEMKSDELDKLKEKVILALRESVGRGTIYTICAQAAVLVGCIYAESGEDNEQFQYNYASILNFMEEEFERLLSGNFERKEMK